MDNLTILIILFSFVIGNLAGGMPDDYESQEFNSKDITPNFFESKKKVASAPLDPNENVDHALQLVANIVGIIGESSSGLTFEITDISLHDCSKYFKDKDVTAISCDEFLDDLSNCDSLGHIKPLLKSAKAKYRKIKGKAASAKLPCSAS